MARKAEQIYQLKVTLDGIRPPIWRRLQVPGYVTLDELHDILQKVMGWHNYHLHEFTIDGQSYGDPENDEFGYFDIKDESRFILSRVAKGVGSRFRYVYDFGDDWSHTLLVEKVLPPEERIQYPRVLKGRRACPPEDVGGPWGYASLLQALNDPRHPERASYLEWIGHAFDPETFDPEEHNARLSSAAARRTVHVTAGLLEAGGSQAPADRDGPYTWSDRLIPAARARAEALPLRRDMVTLLSYLRDNRVVGTQSTGNFPLKAVAAIAANLVKPIPMERSVGNTVFRIRNEMDAWPLYRLHQLVAIAGLVVGGPSRQWRLTALGEKLLTIPAADQLAHLFVNWWNDGTVWLYAPYNFQLTQGAKSFTGAVRDALLALEGWGWTPFEPFADQLIERSRLRLTGPAATLDPHLLHNIIQSVVVRALEEFGALEVQERPHRVLGRDYKEVDSFRMTPLGRPLLESADEAAAG